MSSDDSSKHSEYMRLALDEARKSSRKPTNFCVGAVLACGNEVLTTGYTLECPGNTHAEQSCFIKLSKQYECLDSGLGHRLPEDTVLYTTMEPCNKRSVGNTPCVDRILALKTKYGRQAIQTVCVGVSEPETFVGVNEGKQKLKAAGIDVVVVKGFEDEVLKVATAGHATTTPAHAPHGSLTALLGSGGCSGLQRHYTTSRNHAIILGPHRGKVFELVQKRRVLANARKLSSKPLGYNSMATPDAPLLEPEDVMDEVMAQMECAMKRKGQRRAAEDPDFLLAVQYAAVQRAKSDKPPEGEHFRVSIVGRPAIPAEYEATRPAAGHGDLGLAL
ncbi:hypothetical protein LTR78_004066 [Recurvomyces mirabilis]|uniref:CMP/dCMP-type deaminase domain-containing protein n=1 Tax=Recurvomyces mirabilis TaxID=574656 RepID=A0AAE0WQ20_9PEZI|nr:hypothetical protein LTR78_004066 [Recurvomyces mirabilis]